MMTGAAAAKPYKLTIQKKETILLGSEVALQRTPALAENPKGGIAAAKNAEVQTQ